MSSSELLRRRQEETKNYVARAKVRDSSELTMINQAKASKNYLPTLVSNVISDGDCQRTVYIKGNGTNMTYTNVLQAKQGCAVCSDPDPMVSPGVFIPTPCYDRRKAPFAQQDLSGNVGSGGVLYVPNCQPGFNQYFPTEPTRGSNCTRPHLPYDSA